MQRFDTNEEGGDFRLCTSHCRHDSGELALTFFFLFSCAPPARTATSMSQPSAPPEAEIYQGAVSNALLVVEDANDNLPVAAAVPMGGETGGYSDDPTTTTSSVHYDEPAVTATPVGRRPLLYPTTATTTQQQQEEVYFSDLGLDRHTMASCPFCHQQGVTNLRHLVDTFTIVAAFILFLLFWPICWLPFVLRGCQVTEHYCPNCHRRVSPNILIIS